MTARTTIRGSIIEIRRVVREPALVLWTLFLIFFPFYVVPSGLPQPADWVIIVLAPVLISRWNGQLLNMQKAFRMLLMFTGYALLSNVMWSFALGAFSINLKHGFLLSPTFYIYNSLMLFCVILMYQRYGLYFLWVTVRVVLISVGVQVVASFFMRAYVIRASMFFNNPNQLGYYALLCASLLLLGVKKLELSTLRVTLGLTGCAYLALMSASKAALGAIAMLAIALLITRLRTMILASVVVVILSVTSNPFSRAIEKAQERIDNDQSYGLLEERGYDRVYNHPEYWVFGSGEGDYFRFKDTTVIKSHELHSSGATLFFCYGILGMSLFAAFVFYAFRGAGFRTLMIVLPSFAYGLAHQGLRFTMMWVMFGTVMALKHDASRKQVT